MAGGMKKVTTTGPSSINGMSEVSEGEDEMHNSSKGDRIVNHVCTPSVSQKIGCYVSRKGIWKI